MSTLFQISQALVDLENAIVNADTTDEQQRLLENYLNTEQELHQKLDNYCRLIKEITARSLARAQEAQRIAGLAEQDAQLVEKLETSLLDYMQRHDLNRVQTTLFHIAKVKAGGVLPVVVDSNVRLELVPPQFVREKLTRAIDKEAVREALEHGEELGFARLGQRPERLKIK